MVLFIFGPNDYLVQHKLQELKERYRQKAGGPASPAGGDLNLVTLEGENLTFEDFAAQVQAMPLLFTSRLIIVRDIFKTKNRPLLEKIKDFLPHIPKSSVVVFADFNDVDKRLGLFKALNKPKVAQSCQIFSLGEVKKFILQQVKERGGQIAPPAVETLAEFAGVNLWQVSSELEKLLTYCADRPVAKEDVELLVSRNLASNVFTLIENLTAPNSKAAALRELEVLLASGEPPLKILSLINYQYRSAALVKEAMGKASGSYAIAKSCGLSPFQVTRMMSFARAVSWERLSEIYAALAAVDEAVKTGKIEDREGLKDLVLAV